MVLQTTFIMTLNCYCTNTIYYWILNTLGTHRQTTWRSRCAPYRYLRNTQHYTWGISNYAFKIPQNSHIQSFVSIEQLQIIQQFIYDTKNILAKWTFVRLFHVKQMFLLNDICMTSQHISQFHIEKAV